MKEKLLNEFKKLKIKNLQKLNEYIDFCLQNNQNERIQGKTSYHHILPNKLFPEYSNLTNNKWNGSHLFYSDHYYSHFLFTEAIDDYSQLYAFCAMHNKDIKNDRISKNNLISPEEFQLKMEERSKKHSYYLTKINDDGTSIASTAALKAAETMKNGIRESAEKKRIETITKPIIINGIETTICKEKNRKSLLTKRKIIIIDGVETTIEKEAAKKSRETQTKYGPKFNIYHINGKLISENVPLRKVRELSQSLEFKTKEDYLGKTKRSKITLNIHNRLHLIGYYVEKI